MQLLHRADGEGAYDLPPDAERIAEVERLVESGTGYVTLLGQTVDAGGTRAGGSAICWRLSGGCAARVVHDEPPFHMKTARSGRSARGYIVKRLHLPVQSGSDRMLKAMLEGTRRRGTGARSRCSGRPRPMAP